MNALAYVRGHSFAIAAAGAVAVLLVYLKFIRQSSPAAQAEAPAAATRASAVRRPSLVRASTARPAVKASTRHALPSTPSAERATSARMNAADVPSRHTVNLNGLKSKK